MIRHPGLSPRLKSSNEQPGSFQRASGWSNRGPFFGFVRFLPYGPKSLDRFEGSDLSHHLPQKSSLDSSFGSRLASAAHLQCPDSHDCLQSFLSSAMWIGPGRLCSSEDWTRLGACAGYTNVTAAVAAAVVFLR